MITMEELAEMRANKVISEALYKVIDETIYETASSAAFGRMVLPVHATNEGIGKMSVETTTLGSVTGQVTMTLADLDIDRPETTSTTVTIPVIGEKFRIDARQMSGNIDTAMVAKATRAVMYKEDGLIFGGSSKYSVTGIYSGAGLSESTALDFGTAGNALKKVANAINALNDAGITSAKGYNLLVSTTQAAQLQGSVLSGIGREAKEVESMLAGGGIYSIPAAHLADGTGILMPVKEALTGLVEFYVPYDIRSVLEYDKFGGLDGAVLEAGAPRIIDSNAIVALSNI